MAGFKKNLFDEGLGFIKDVAKIKPKVEVKLPDISELEAKLEELYPPKQISRVEQALEASAESKTSGKACDICALDHFSTCAGLMQHARDFALREGIESQEVITRIARCREQLNSLEREDLTPANIVKLSPAEQKIAHIFLPKSADLRHALNDITSIDKLEKVAANAQEISSNFQSEIFKFQLKREIPRPAPRESSQSITLEEAKKLAAEEAAREVEARWPSQESNPTGNPPAVTVIGAAPRPLPPERAIEREEEKLERRRRGLQPGTHLQPPPSPEEEARIRQLRAQGLTLSDIATRMHRSSTSVFNCLRRERPPLHKAITAERLEKIVSLRRKGLTLEKIGQQMGVTRSYVLYLLHRAGERVDPRKAGEDLQERLLAVNDILATRDTMPQLEAAANKLRDVYDDALLLLQITPRIPYLGPQPYNIGFKAALAEEVLRTGVWCLEQRQKGYETRVVPRVGMREVEIPLKRKELLETCGESAREAAQGTISSLPGYETKSAQILALVDEMMEEAKT